ncbi:MAG: hypothetical protein V7665_03950, partial [Parasphingorhabdus sp.]
AVARNELRTRRQRNSYFSNSQVFGDPAWELVLEAYIATAENRCVALSDLENGLRKPHQIITRLAAILEVEGYVERCRSHKNFDLGCVKLTNHAAALCEQCLDLKLGGFV